MRKKMMTLLAVSVVAFAGLLSAPRAEANFSCPGPHPLAPSPAALPPTERGEPVSGPLPFSLFSRSGGWEGAAEEGRAHEGLGGRAAPLHVPRRDRAHRDGGSTVDRRGTGPAAGLRDALPRVAVRVSMCVS